MAHFTLHAASGVSTTIAWTSAGFDGIAFGDGTRAALIDDVVNPRSLWLALRWVLETSGSATVDDLGDVLVGMLLGPDFQESGVEQGDEIAALVERLREIRK